MRRAADERGFRLLERTSCAVVCEIDTNEYRNTERDTEYREQQL